VISGGFISILRMWRSRCRGGAPWGFRLQGGAEHNKPLQVSKVRKHSKACRAGLREEDELVSINETSCGDLSHGQAMDLIDLLGCNGVLVGRGLYLPLTHGPVMQQLPPGVRPWSTLGSI
uniref:Synaptopodin 2-like protein n=1 Tax=Denticeps clupeoides TaxID=299321 RepID=A0AAY4C4Q2_9TELE